MGVIRNIQNRTLGTPRPKSEHNIEMGITDILWGPGLSTSWSQ